VVILPGIPPPVIIESSEFLRCVTVLDHHMSVVEFERHETIDKVLSKFSQLPDSCFEMVPRLGNSQWAVITCSSLRRSNGMPSWIHLRKKVRVIVTYINWITLISMRFMLQHCGTIAQKVKPQ